MEWDECRGGDLECFYLWEQESLGGRTTPCFQGTVFALHFLNWEADWMGGWSRPGWLRRTGFEPEWDCSDPRAGAGRARWPGWGADGSRCRRRTSLESPRCCASLSAAGESCYPALTSCETGCLESYLGEKHSLIFSAAAASLEGGCRREGVIR